ncbi:glycosyl transferase [Psychromonas sp. psych-6C06]|uniref:glycosyltransferase n=1 Tax=Psychromonas sp. psych-6C06 TaxID=2058089 RepID=UPI000C337BDB|nr:glycosyltransferase [Psychromonas sp. psych-6C06]PKF61722.1 glycosyl transferase [Psychromonas sp. psych-6C06]
MLDIKRVQLKTEEEIIASWSDKEKIVVSVICATYNHELYIEDAITGFLMQKTDFSFEVIIHDDASTDQTTNIIKRYQKLYPNIIKPIYQTENKYSKGNFKPGLYMAKRAKGFFLAWCEGDDYWCEDKKLDFQVRALEKHGTINLCIHDAFVIDGAGSPSNYNFPLRSNSVQVVNYLEVYKTSGQFSPTASMLVRASVLSDIPSFVYSAPIVDFFIEALSGRGGILYLPNKMSVYRRGIPGAWSSAIISNIGKTITFNLGMVDSLLELQKYLKNGESKYVMYKINYLYFSLANLYIQQQDVYNSAKYQMKSFHGKLPLKSRINTFKEWLKSILYR